MNIIVMEEDNSIFNGEYEDRQGFGKCYICNQLSAITYTVNSKEQVIEESKECYSCKEL